MFRAPTGPLCVNERSRERGRRFALLRTGGRFVIKQQLAGWTIVGHEESPRDPSTKSDAGGTPASEFSSRLRLPLVFTSIPLRSSLNTSRLLPTG